MQPTGSPDTEIMRTASARLARLPLTTHHLSIADREWSIVAVADQSSLTAMADELEHFPFGLMLWEAAPVLAEALPDLVTPGQRVLELGAGVGLTGLVAARLGALVVQSDHSAEALALCAENARRNGLHGIGLTLGDWHDWRIDGRFDLILGSDILYDADLHSPVLDVLTRSLAPGGRVLLSDPGRSTAPAFVTLLERAGWHVTRRRRRVPALAPVRPGDTVVVTIIEASI